jgi:DNA polymerase I
MSELLNGHGIIKGITSIRASKSGNVTLWCRRDNQVIRIKEQFRPFLLTSNIELVKNLPCCSVMTLKGDLDYKYKIEISNYQIFEAELISRYRLLYKSDIEKIHEMEDVKIFNASEQNLIQSGNTYFKGLDFNDLIRMQIDIETTGLLEDKDAKIFMIAIKVSNGIEKVIHGYDESLLLNQLNYIIQKINPDIIENHNIFRFDLPFLYRRFKYHGIKFLLGREGDQPFIYEDTLKHGGSTIPFNRYCVAGREIIDTMHSAMRYEGMTRKLGGSFKLKHVAKILKVNREGEENYIDGSDIYKTYKVDPERVVNYALYDVREVDGLVVKLNQDKFFLAQMIPMQYEKICTVGSSKIIELPMVRNYLYQNHSIPKPQAISDEERKELYRGGYCEVFDTGLFKLVTKLDVKSMYPSIILANGIGPHSDPLNIFQPFLKSITDKRLYYKSKSEEDDSYGPIQNALKIVINSSYGYLGYSYGLFNNIYGAMKVTEKGQEIVQLMIELINNNGGTSIEADTDGVICKLPEELSPGDFCSTVQDGLIDYSYIDIDV